jgi:hypothetical protein
MAFRSFKGVIPKGDFYVSDKTGRCGMSEPIHTSSESAGAPSPDLPDDLRVFFDQFQPAVYEPKNCLSESRLQEIATGVRPRDPHADNCPHCSSIIAALETAQASKEDGLYRFMQAVREQANAQVKKSSQRAAFWESALARLRSDSAFRIAAVAATATILLAVAVLVPKMWHSPQNSAAVNMPLQDQGKYMLVMAKMKSLPTQKLSRTELGPKVHEINDLIKDIDETNLAPNERGQLAEEIHDLTMALNSRQMGTPTPQLAASGDVAKVNDLHEVLAKLPGQVQDSEVDVKEISAKSALISGPFKHEQLQPGSSVYKVLANYANKEQMTDVSIQAPTETAVIPSSAFMPKH